MKRIFFYLIIIVATIPFITTSCIEDDFTTSSSDLLTFSSDTIAFDTIFTDLTTPTASFRIFNKSKKMINISEIKIKGESNAKFYLNVDGIKGEVFNNVEIRGEDSIFVFVQAHIAEVKQNAPLEFKDKIEFTTNGQIQNVVLTAWAQDVNRITKGVISENTTFDSEKPYVIFDTLQVEKDATLTLVPGTRLFFHDKAALNVKGRLIANGTMEKQIDLRGDRTDHVVGEIGFDIMSRQWGGVNFEKDSYGNEMSFVYMRGSTTGVTIDSCDTQQRKLHIFNSILHNATNSVLTSNHAWVDAEGSEFSEAGSSVVRFVGGKVRIVNCTFANYYLFAAISGPIMNLSYLFDKDKADAPLMDATFDNCIIYGNAGDITPGDLKGANVYLRNVLLKSKGTDDNNFINCKWGADPKFYTVREDYIFDYRLKNDSEAIGAGNSSYCPQSARYDRYGQDRFANSDIDLGAYVWVKAEEDKENSKK